METIYVSCCTVKKYVLCTPQESAYCDKFVAISILLFIFGVQSTLHILEALEWIMRVWILLLMLRLVRMDEDDVGARLCENFVLLLDSDQKISLGIYYH